MEGMDAIAEPLGIGGMGGLPEPLAAPASVGDPAPLGGPATPGNPKPTPPGLSPPFPFPTPAAGLKEKSQTLSSRTRSCPLESTSGVSVTEQSSLTGPNELQGNDSARDGRCRSYTHVSVVFEVLKDSGSGKALLSFCVILRRVTDVRRKV
jgi:hypothetical protein